MTALKTLLFTILVPGTVALLAPWALLANVPEPLAVELGWSRWLGLALILVGAAVYFRCAWDFTFAGKGTPAPWDPPRRLVAGGLYQLSRNPMYVGVVTVLAGEAVICQSSVLLVYALAVAAGFHLRVLYYEEPVLRLKFGEPYERYCRAVPRWLPGAAALTRRQAKEG